MAAFADPVRRAEVARDLAACAGVQDLLVFIHDPIVGALVPAPGFMQSLPETRQWQTFLSQCSGGGTVTGDLPFPTADALVAATALVASDGSVMVLLGGSPRMEVADDLCALLPLLSAALKGERMAAIAESHAAVASEAARQAKSLAASLDKARETLQQTVRKAESASEAANAANRAKDQFIAVLSHELRTPLTPVLTATYMLENDPALSADAKNVISMIRRNVQLETRLIDDLLDLTRLSRGKLQLEFANVDVHEKLRHVIEICDCDLRAKHLHLTLRFGAKVQNIRGDPARLQQILWNLLKNAVKFTPDGGEIEIATENDPDAGIRLCITDTGVGIGDEDLDRIFQPFDQGAHTDTRLFGGLGVGLSITKALVVAHGGTIIASSPGKDRGATFTLRFPTVQSAPVPSPGPSQTTSERKRQRCGRILLVDDHDDTARMMARLLGIRGFTVRTANSVGSALQIAGAEPFDLLISDIGLPDGSGMDLIRQLHAERPLKGIALSGFGQDEDIQRSRAAGFTEHLTKPIDGSRLLAAIERVVES